MRLLYTYLIVLPLVAGGLSSCTKDKVPLPPEPTKWEQISGSYKVYDTNGVYLYEMQISHHTGIGSNGKQTDSLKFNNFDDQFVFTEVQSNEVVSNWPKNYFQLGNHNPIKDKQGKRWNIQGLTNSKFNSLVDDTIRLRFNKSNIQYYISDLTPHFSGLLIHVAIKQP